jgi:transcriptional regulator with XRE-family HTH domain
VTAGGHSAAQALARSLKRRRLERAISLSELARRAGVSKATLSSLERGNGNPSVDTVWALAKALNVPFGELFDDHEDDAIHVHRMEDAQVVTEEDGFRGRRLLSRQGRGGFELYALDLEAGARRDAAAHSPGVVEHVLVILGRVDVGPDDDPATLEAGDYLTFAADLPHHYHALDGLARLLSLHDYPPSV